MWIADGADGGLGDLLIRREMRRRRRFSAGGISGIKVNGVNIDEPSLLVPAA